MIRSLELTHELTSAIEDPSPLDSEGASGVSISRFLRASRNYIYLCLYQTSDGYYARRGEFQLVRTNAGHLEYRALWAGTIEIPKHNYEKFIGQLTRLGVYELQDFYHEELILDGVTYEVSTKSQLIESDITLSDPDIYRDPKLTAFQKMADWLLTLPIKRFQNVSRFDRLLTWFR